VEQSRPTLLWVCNPSLFCICIFAFSFLIPNFALRFAARPLTRTGSLSPVLHSPVPLNSMN
jgi:hypothetical protein